jgi:hypothetical protein
MLTACAGGGSGGGGRLADSYNTDYYIQHAAGNYTPPGPASDPWGPYIRIAASRFDVPQTWIRQVMRVESGGHEYLGGQLTVSSAGAMGLMQLEPVGTLRPRQRPIQPVRQHHGRHRLHP